MCTARMMWRLPHLKVQGSPSRNLWGGALAPVGIVCLADEQTLLAFLHLCQAQIPGLDDAAYEESMVQLVMIVDGMLQQKAVIAGMDAMVEGYQRCCGMAVLASSGYATAIGEVG